MRSKLASECGAFAAFAIPRNLVNLSGVGKGFAARTILDDISLGVSAGERIGVVGANGAGKSTLLALIDGGEAPDRGAVTQTGGVTIARLAQDDELTAFATVGAALVGDPAEPGGSLGSSASALELAARRPAGREVLAGLLGGMGLTRLPGGLQTLIADLSGGERRRIALARLLLDTPELLLLDEPTNHLDVEAITFLAGHLARRTGTLLVVTHDRWFLDAICTATWEVDETRVHRYEGGYAAYVLARAERERIDAVREDRRRQLVRKELAWLRRGPPARTAKPRFRTEAANALIADEPPVRDTTELLRFAASRLGGKVIEVENVSFAHDPDRPPSLLHDLTWRLGPGERLALVGVNGSGKSTLLRILAGELAPTHGRVERGATVRLAFLHQDTAEVSGEVRVLQALEQVRGRARLSGGQEITAGRLAERFGFGGERGRTFVRDLSGGERRRLALMRLLMDEPNVLLLDEPTNDLDIDTLTALEDLLDSWPGTLVVVSHDRYFVERVCDGVFALDSGGGGVRHLPGGIDQYLAELAAASESLAPALTPAPKPHSGPRSAAPAGSPERRRGSGEQRALRREVARLEREIDRRAQSEASLQAEMALAASDHLRLGELADVLRTASDERAALEAEWLAASEALEAGDVAGAG